MVQFTVNPTRFDPYKNFKFRVRFGGDSHFVPGVCRVSGLIRHTQAVLHRDGGEPSQDRSSPGRTAFDPIRLERGVTHDTAFEDWANKVWQLRGAEGAEVSLRDFRKDIRIELLNEAGQPVLSYLVYRCWPIAYQALPELDAHEPGVAVESITLQHEGWERDRSVTEPVEPVIDTKAPAGKPAGRRAPRSR